MNQVELYAQAAWGSPYQEPEPWRHISDIDKTERRKRTKEKKRIKKQRRK